MAIDFSLMLEKKVLDRNMLCKELKNVGFMDVIKCPSQESVFRCESCYNSLGFAVSLLEANEYPYNAFDTAFFEYEFVFEQVLRINFNKEFDSLISYENAMKIVFGLMRNTNTKALLDMCMCRELCFFNGDGRLYINKSSKIWESINIHRELSQWKLSEFEL